ncbi:MAG: DUF2283 domain-containing protein [Candidatus Coatesbacteria bacterium]|nr:DUF2283 domain-containing protein [Candidatus Coatesbacteria bacterium]
MRITYDPQADAVYFRFVEGPREVTTLRLTEDIAINYDPRGGVVGLEILSAREHLKFSAGEPELEIENLNLMVASSA